MKRFYQFLCSERGDIAWPGLVGCLIVAFVAVIAYKVLFAG